MNNKRIFLIAAPIAVVLLSPLLLSEHIPSIAAVVLGLIFGWIAK